MFDNKPASLLSLCFLVCVTEGLRTITAEPGQNVTLTCRAPSSSEILGLQWTRPDLDPDYVFFYRDKKFDRVNQHPSFKERVELKDSQMKDGDVSVTLKDVTFNDTGTYECRVVQGQSKAPELISTVHLRVVPAGEKAEQVVDGGDVDGGKTEKVTKEEGSYGHVGLAVGLTVFVALFVSVIVFLKRWKPIPTSYQRAPEEPEPKVSNVSV